MGSLEPCGPCADYRRGAASDSGWGGVVIHSCARVPEGRFVEFCPCGCFGAAERRSWAAIDQMDMRGPAVAADPTRRKRKARRS